MVDYFYQGGGFMWPILGALLFGLGFAGERFYSLLISGIDTQQFFNDIKSIINKSGPDGALKLCETTEGPVSAIFHAGLSRMHRGIEEVEKAAMIQVIDKPFIPWEHDSPKRGIILLITAFMSFFAGIILVYSKEYLFEMD